MIDRKIHHNAAVEPPRPPLRVLLVEDNSDNQLLFRAYLKKLACHLEIAENGMIGVEKFQAGSYDLVIMDMQMPVMDGYTATQLIREWEKQQGRKPTPIVALTANALQPMVEKSLAAGCTAHVPKPVLKNAFLEIIVEYAGGGE